LISFTAGAWDDYQYWSQADQKKLARINELINQIVCDPFKGMGKPEPLKHGLAECWSRRIDKTHRLVYKPDPSGDVIILQCRYHY
jgi:toxin YoeB